jgi:hypothetical protein
LLRGIGSHWLLWPRLPASLPLANAPFAKHGRRRRQGVQIISFIAGRDNAEPSIRQSLHREGRGIWITSGDRTPWHKEGGKGSKPVVVHFQIRPSPLAD